MYLNYVVNRDALLGYSAPMQNTPEDDQEGEKEVKPVPMEIDQQEESPNADIEMATFIANKGEGQRMQVGCQDKARRMQQHEKLYWDVQNQCLQNDEEVDHVAIKSKMQFIKESADSATDFFSSNLVRNEEMKFQKDSFLLCNLSNLLATKSKQIMTYSQRNFNLDTWFTEMTIVTEKLLLADKEKVLDTKEIHPLLSMDKKGLKRLKQHKRDKFQVDNDDLTNSAVLTMLGYHFSRSIPFFTNKRRVFDIKESLELFEIPGQTEAGMNYIKAPEIAILGQETAEEMQGIMEKDDEEEQQTSRQAKTQKKVLDESEPLVELVCVPVTELPQDGPTMSKDLALLKECLKREIRNNGGSVGYFRFVIDYKSYAKTVENMFLMSFLISEKHVKVVPDKDGFPRIYEIGKLDANYIEIAESYGLSAQAVTSINSKLWSEYVKEAGDMRTMIGPIPVDPQSVQMPVLLDIKEELDDQQ